jgi:hypothetical protein
MAATLTPTLTPTATAIPSQFQRQSLEHCFRAFVWQGKTVASEATTIDAQRPFSWKTTAVEDLFRRYNWAGRDRPLAMAITPDSTHAEIALDISLRLPVTQFFDCFTWAGQPNIAPLPTPAVSDNQGSPKRALNLDNFSKLF